MKKLTAVVIGYGSRGSKYANYNVTFVNGKLTIKAVDLIVKLSISKASFTYNGKADYELTVTYVAVFLYITATPWSHMLFK